MIVRVFGPPPGSSPRRFPPNAEPRCAATPLARSSAAPSRPAAAPSCGIVKRPRRYSYRVKSPSTPASATTKPPTIRLANLRAEPPYNPQPTSIANVLTTTELQAHHIIKHTDWHLNPGDALSVTPASA